MLSTSTIIFKDGQIMRLDQWLLKNQMVRSRSQAEELIKRGDVKVLNLRTQTWDVITKPSFVVSEDLDVDGVKVHSDISEYVSRSGFKLYKALEHLKVNVEGLKCLDVGQSTGGFSQVLLEQQAGLVVGLDVGHNQLNEKLKNHKNLLSFENLDIRNVKSNSEFIKLCPFDLVVIDVSFISLTQVLSAVADLIHRDSKIVALVKPQFELSKVDLDKKGRVKDEKKLLEVESKIKDYIKIQLPFEILEYFPSDLEGKDGNKEFFIYLKNLKEKN